MRKKKDGTIIASLTEVKNKTGDIFSLVDEYGEIVLTSYNKPKYKISKISVGSMLEVEQPAKRKQVQKVAKNTKTNVKPVQQPKVKPIAVPAKKVEEKTLVSAELIDKLAKMKVWDRDAKLENKYIKAILTPLQ